jgi:phage protein U
MMGNAIVMAAWLAVGVAALLGGLVWLRSVEHRSADARRQGRARQQTFVTQERTEGDRVSPEAFPDTLAS